MASYYKKKGGFPWLLVLGAAGLGLVLFRWEWIKSLLKKKIA